MSPRAAARLESIGFERVYDYVAGKADWGSWAYPRSESPTEARVGPCVRTDVPTCHAGDRLLATCELLDESGWDTCFVVDERSVVLGRLGRRAVPERPDTAAEDAMTLGPSTHRPSARLVDVVERMRTQKLTSLPVTRPDGTLAGLLLRDDAERALERFDAPRS
jgi:Mg/Co/Ni transporter MgtE